MGAILRMYLLREEFLKKHFLKSNFETAILKIFFLRE